MKEELRGQIINSLLICVQKTLTFRCLTQFIPLFSKIKRKGWKRIRTTCEKIRVLMFVSELFFSPRELKISGKKRKKSLNSEIEVRIL